MKRLIINARESEKRYALVDGGKVVRIYNESPYQKSLVGNIYLGLVERIVPSINGAFIQIGRGEKGYLPLNTVPTGLDADHGRTFPYSTSLKQGDKVIVQVIKDKTALKEYTVSANIELTGKGLVYMPFGKYVAVSKKLDEEDRAFWKKWGLTNKSPTEALLIRTLANTLGPSLMEAELEKLRNQFFEIQKGAQNKRAPSLLLEKDLFMDQIITLLELENPDEVHCDSRSFIEVLSGRVGKDRFSIIYFQGNENIFSHFQLDKSLEEIQKKIVWLNNGANIVIEEAEAFTIIDVNSAKFTGSQETNEAAMKTNRLAALEIARQIKLRNISGIILIDFINMQYDENREEILRLMSNELKNTEPRTVIHGFTHLGLLELSRKKTTASVKEKSSIPCPVCHGTGSVPSPEAYAFKLERELWELKGKDVSKVVVEATDDILDFFRGEMKVHHKTLEEMLQFEIEFQKVDGSIPFYDIKRVLG